MSAINCGDADHQCGNRIQVYPVTSHLSKFQERKYSHDVLIILYLFRTLATLSKSSTMTIASQLYLIREQKNSAHCSRLP